MLTLKTSIRAVNECSIINTYVVKQLTKQYMAIPKKGSRLIVVDGDRYRWRIRQKPSRSQSDYGCNMTFAVEHFDKSGATKVVEMLRAHPMCSGKQTVPVVLSDVEYSIRQAIAIKLEAV